MDRKVRVRSSKSFAHPSVQALIDGEAKRTDRVDVIPIMTPNDRHHAVCSQALDAGSVTCDKPLRNDLISAVSPTRKIEATGAKFRLTYRYTGYSMVR
jgi:predicted dehydrogenase